MKVDFGDGVLSDTGWTPVQAEMYQIITRQRDEARAEAKRCEDAREWLSERLAEARAEISRLGELRAANQEIAQRQIDALREELKAARRSKLVVTRDTLIDDLELAGVTVTKCDLRDHIAAQAGLFDALLGDEIKIRPSEPLDPAAPAP